jgi:pentatricopeptide repeat protein
VLLTTGLQPIAESYVVLIYGFVAANNVEVAKAVFASMQRAPVDARLGWYMLCTSLFKFGYVTAPSHECTGVKLPQFFYLKICSRTASYSCSGMYFVLPFAVSLHVACWYTSNAVGLFYIPFNH